MTVIERTPSGFPLGQLLAEKARDAERDGPCCLCPRRVLRGQRVARMADGGWAHTGCLSALKPQRRGTPR